MLTFYQGYGNWKQVELTSGGIAQSLSAVTKVEITFDGTTYDSDANPELFDWATDPMKLGLRMGLAPNIDVTKDKKVEIVTYDPTYPTGFVWGRIAIKIDEVS